MNKKFLLDGTKIDLSTKETQRETTSHIIIHEDAKNIAETILKKRFDENTPWYKSKRRLLIALILYFNIKSEGEGFALKELKDALPFGQKRKTKEEMLWVLDEMFMLLESRHPEHIAIQYYKSSRTGRPETFLIIAQEVYEAITKFIKKQEQ